MHVPLETGIMANNPLNNASVYQAFFEILGDPDAAARISQAVIEYLRDGETRLARITQVVIETLTTRENLARVSQIVIEVINHVGPMKVFCDEASNGDFAA